MPDKNIFILKAYHKSSRYIPLSLTSLIISKYTTNTIYKLSNIITVIHLSSHSFISTSSIIGDYVKFKKITTPIRVANVLLHGTSLIGYIYSINQINI